jgi:Protein of unknown function (DUF2459)
VLANQVVFGFVILFGASCAGPIVELWPPKPGAPTHKITVTMDAWHSVVGVWPAADRAGEELGTMREWGFADRNYYLERNNGVSGCCGALFWPTAAVLRVAPAGHSVIDLRDAPASRWTFQLSEAGYRRLVAFLHAERANTMVLSRLAQSNWYEAKYSYQAFHHCNHWTARALRTAGLPVWSFYAMFKWSFEAQLDRAATWTQ